MTRRALVLFSFLLCFSWFVEIPRLRFGLVGAQEKVSAPPLAGTQPLTVEGDIAAQMVAGIDKFLLREIELSVERREKFWKRDFSSPEAYNKSIEPNRQRLKKILGVVDERVPFDAPEIIASVGNALRGVPPGEGREANPIAIARGESYEIIDFRWP